MKGSEIRDELTNLIAMREMIAEYAGASVDTPTVDLTRLACFALMATHPNTDARKALLAKLEERRRT